MNKYFEKRLARVMDPRARKHNKKRPTKFVRLKSHLAAVLYDIQHPVDIGRHQRVMPYGGETAAFKFCGQLGGTMGALTVAAAMDGIDVLSVLFAKKLGLSVGSFVMIFNTMLYIVCGIVIDSWILPLYSIVTYFVGSKTIDFVVDGIDRRKCAMIVTTESEKITKVLSDSFSSTGTVLKGVGGYSKSDKEIIFFILSRFQIYTLKTIVTDIDPGAFISIHEVSDIIHNAG